MLGVLSLARTRVTRDDDRLILPRPACDEAEAPREAVGGDFINVWGQLALLRLLRSLQIRRALLGRIKLRPVRYDIPSAVRIDTEQNTAAADARVHSPQGEASLQRAQHVWHIDFRELAKVGDVIGHAGSPAGPSRSVRVRQKQGGQKSE